MNTVIKVENLGKKYIIGHQQEKYIALRDVIANGFSNIFKRGNKNSFSKEEFWALKDINFEVKKGDRLGIIGKNGAGKSTILKILSRITEPSIGRVSINGRVASLLEVGTGFHPELTGRENIYLNGAVLGMSRSEIKHKFDEIVAFAEVEKFLDTPVKRYSSGMYVRLAFAVASHLEPEIMVVDEVLAVGDVQFQKKCLGKMENVSKKEGRTILFVSHDMRAIQTLCERCIVLEQGRIIYAGEVSEAVNFYLASASGEKNNTLMEWAASPERVFPLNKYLRVEKFYIHNQEGARYHGAMLVSKSYKAVIEFKLIRPDPNIIIAIGYYALNGSLIFLNNLIDEKNMEIDELVPGQYRLETDIPVELFATGHCYMEVLCVVHMAGWILPVDNESRIKIEFYRDVMPTTEIALGYQQPLMPAFSWTIKSLKK